jgi:transposase
MKSFDAGIATAMTGRCGCAIPKRLQATVGRVCTDMYDGYINAVREVLPRARVVIDRFPVAKADRACADQLRKQALKRRTLSKARARAYLDAWASLVKDSALTCFDRFLTPLQSHLDAITNYFLDRQTSGFVEGLNHKIKVLKRRCYGIFSPGHLFPRLHLDLAGYRS